jgi:2-polyprenyl-3-methyl-5-hydroxy-6-metoxy-1,4-benzoquinol methylase
MTEINYIEINKKSWNKKTDAHLASDFYDMKSFVQGQSSLNDIELNLLGDVKGKSILHLQCHFGQDSISLARMGAEVTGADLSDNAINNAVKIASEMNVKIDFVCCDIYDLPKHLDKKFDIVFTSYGTIGWLPDLDKWSKVIDNFLKPGGKFIFVDFHPVIWMYDDNFENIAYNYFLDKPIIETEHGTYADRNADITVETVGWNHALSEVMTSLLQNHLTLEEFKEYDYSPYNCFKGMQKIGDKKYRLEKFGNKVPLVYSIIAIKKNKQ